MRYRLPFAIGPVNWSQLPAARQIALVPKSRHLARFVDAWASTPPPGKKEVLTVSVQSAPWLHDEGTCQGRGGRNLPVGVRDWL